MSAAHQTTVVLAKLLDCACGGVAMPIEGKQRINGRMESKTYYRCPLCFACGPMTDTNLDAMRGWNGVRRAQMHSIERMDAFNE